MVVLDVYTSIIVILIVGWLGALTSQLFRLPRIVCMILFGIGLLPVLHPAVMDTPLTVSTSTGPLTLHDAQNPASSIRSVALLVALARGGLSVKLSYFRVLGLPMIVIATVPYFLEFLIEGLVTPRILPASAGFGPSTPSVAFAAASVWAPLSPSIVIPNMLAFVEKGLTAAGRLVLVGAPLEVSTALLTEGIFDSYITATNLNKDPNTVLYFIPVYIIGSIAYGFAFAAGYLIYTRLRQAKAIACLFGKMDPIEPLFVFLLMFLLCYSTSIDDVNVPRLIGFFSAVSMGIGVQYLLPEVGDALCLQLKPAWTFAECFLFVLTGCVIRPVLDGGNASVVFGPFFAILLLGQLGPMVGDILASFLWQITLLRTAPWTWKRHEWRDLLGRVAFCWVATMPKATLQASLPSKLSKTFKAGNYGAAAAFVGPAAAIAILYMATLGSVLTFSAGSFLATYFQNQETAVGNQTTEIEATQLCTTVQGTPGKERVGPIINVLTGVGSATDGLVAGQEVTIDFPHHTASSYLTGTGYADIAPITPKVIPLVNEPSA